MRRTLRRLIILAFALLLASLVFARGLTDWLWFESLGYSSLLVVPWLWQLAAGAGGALLSFLILYASLVAARPALARASLRPELTRTVLAGPWARVQRGAVVLVVVLALLLGFGVARRWMDIAMFFYQQPFGVRDPVLHREVSFYVYSLPVARLLLSVVFAAVLLSMALSGLIYAVAGILDWRRRGEGLQGRPRAHLLLLLAALALVWAAESWLGRYDLLFSPRGVAFGATYTDVHVRLPARTVTGVLAAAAGLLTAGAARGLKARYAAALAVAALVVAVGGEAAAGLVQQLVVKPGELAREEPFLDNHIRMTRRAFGLEGMREVPFDPKPGLDPADLAAEQDLLKEIRLWDWRPLGTAYSQLQEFRPYYDFIEVDVDRYRVDGRTRQVMLAVRELNAARLQNPTWINVRLQYTHGYGAVMSPVADVTSQGLPRLVISNIPPRSEPGWPELARPQVYFGELPADWVVVNTRRPEFDYPSGDENAFTRYTGRDGIRLSPANRVLFAARFGSMELLFSPEVTSDSRVILYRTVMERLRRLMPYLRYDRDPYAVIRDDGTLVWMVDAYTTTDRFPYVRPVAGWGSYARNSVKVVVDAYDGTVDFYQVDEQDPLASSLSALFGGFMKPGSAMPADLRRHWRYPEDLFTLQATVLTNYHMTRPAVFYNQEDRWDIGREVYGETESVMQPYYAMVELGAGPEFALFLPFTAAGKPNMVAWMVARCDEPHYGELLVYRLPKDRLTYGPMQIEARINQDPDISRELTLWGQRGSRVLRGNLIVQPVAGTLLYVKPLFLVSEQSQLPELRRVVVATGTQLAMASDLDGALGVLTGRAPPAAPGAVPAAPVTPGQEGGAGPPPGGAPSVEEVRRALEALREARRRLGEGDWEAFGRSMEQIERLLERLAGGS